MLRSSASNDTTLIPERTKLSCSLLHMGWEKGSGPPRPTALIAPKTICKPPELIGLGLLLHPADLKLSTRWVPHFMHLNKKQNKAPAIITQSRAREFDLRQPPQRPPKKSLPFFLLPLSTLRALKGWWGAVSDPQQASGWVLRERGQEIRWMGWELPEAPLAASRVPVCSPLFSCLAQGNEKTHGKTAWVK